MGKCMDGWMDGGTEDRMDGRMNTVPHQQIRVTSLKVTDIKKPC